MVVLIGIEGAGGNANNPSTGYTGSFVSEIVKKWPGPKKYGAGPHKPIGGIENVAQRMLPWAYQLYQNNNQIGLAILGYSRGGASAIRLCQLLQGHGIDVDCLALLDAIDRDYSIGTSIPNNVKMAVHARRNYMTMSRPDWGNCGTSAPNIYNQGIFFVSHWGASGVPAHNGVAGIPAGLTPQSYVSEAQMPSGVEYDTKVTWQQDINDAPRMEQFIMGFLNKLYRRKNQNPGGGNPGDGNPGGGNPGKGPKGQEHIVATGETLSLITRKYWGDLLLFPLVYDANASVIGSNWNLIQPGMKLTIPDKSSYTEAELNEARARARGG